MATLFPLYRDYSLLVIYRGRLEISFQFKSLWIVFVNLLLNWDIQIIMKIKWISIVIEEKIFLLISFLISHFLLSDYQNVWKIIYINSLNTLYNIIKYLLKDFLYNYTLTKKRLTYDNFVINKIIWIIVLQNLLSILYINDKFMYFIVNLYIVNFINYKL